jgi:hypothetical protein
MWEKIKLMWTSISFAHILASRFHNPTMPPQVISDIFLHGDACAFLAFRSPFFYSSLAHRLSAKKKQLSTMSNQWTT